MAVEKTVKISPEAKALLKRISGESGQAEKVIVDRMLRWADHWHVADDAGRDMIGAIVGYLPASRRPDFARLILEKMAEIEETKSDAAALDESANATIAETEAQIGITPNPYDDWGTRMARVVAETRAPYKEGDS